MRLGLSLIQLIRAPNSCDYAILIYPIQRNVNIVHILTILFYFMRKSVNINYVLNILGST